MACLSGFGAQFRLVLIPIGVVATVCLTCSHIFFCVFRVTFWRLGAANRFATLPDKWLKQFRFFFPRQIGHKMHSDLLAMKNSEWNGQVIRMIASVKV